MLCSIRIPNVLLQVYSTFQLLPIDYSMERLVHMVNSDLADTLGNLLLRISSKRLIPGIADSGLQYHQRDMFPLAGCSEELASAKDLELISQLHKLPGWFLNYSDTIIM